MSAQGQDNTSHDRQHRITLILVPTGQLMFVLATLRL